MEPRNNGVIAANLERVRARVAEAAHAAGRAPADVAIVAVAKGQPRSAIEDAWAAGQRMFGESYVQEAGPHMAAAPRAAWHFIGRIQANKTREIAERFGWVHSVDRARIAERLSAQRPTGLPPLDVCVQLNLDDEPTKGGVGADAALALAEAVAALPNLRLRGVMAIPRETGSPDAQHAAFAAVRRVFDSLRAAGHDIDTLSMGMSADLEAAVAEGATLVRIGTAIFGARR